MPNPLQSSSRHVLARLLTRWTALVAVLSLLYCVYVFLPFYQTPYSPPWAREQTVKTLNQLYGLLLLGALPWYWWRLRRQPAQRGLRACEKMLLGAIILRRLAASPSRKAAYQWRWWHPRIRLLLMGLLVKGFFFPLLLRSAFVHGYWLWVELGRSTAELSWHDLMFDHGFILCLQALFLLDSVIFTIGYAIESRRVGSTIKSVEPTLLGWTAALACYPPFNEMFTLRVIPSASTVSPVPWTLPPFMPDLQRVLVLIAVGVFAWASVALGWKASNLTNRGIVTSGPYRWVRHPAYTAKCFGWWVEGLANLNHWPVVFGLAGWTAVYVLRAWTEERHLMRDPDYQRYLRQVRWRFIPGVL